LQHRRPDGRNEAAVSLGQGGEVALVDNEMSLVLRALGLKRGPPLCSTWHGVD
jgi:hypothetical protein